MSEKISIIGAGDIGMNSAEILALKGYNVTLYNRYHEENNRPSPYWLAKQGLIMDLNDALYIPSCGKVKLTHDLSELDDSQCCIITSGAKRKNASETREELAANNAKIMRNYINFIAENEGCLFLIVTNPVDLLTRFLIEEVAKYSGVDKDQVAKRIVGVSYVDTMRMYNIVASFLDVKYPNENYANITGYSIAEHGSSMVPLMSGVKIDNKLLSNFASLEEIDNLKKQVKFRGNDIINLTGASSIKGPAHASMHMVDLILSNKAVTIPSSCWDGVRAIGQVSKFVKGKYHSVIDVEMTQEEQKEFENSCKILDEQYVKMINY